MYTRNKLRKCVAKILLMRRYGIEIGNAATIGIGFRLIHPKNITIGKYVNMGKNVTMFHGVTLGSKIPILDMKNASSADYPQIGDNVTICANATILGGVQIADGTVVAAGAVLVTDTEQNSVYAGVPARRIK
jgi:serine O-acetyltransferase